MKYVAVAPKFRESSAFAQVVTHLTEIVAQKHRTSFVFTRPENIVRFEGLGYKHLISAEPLFALLEFGFESILDYKKYLISNKAKLAENTKISGVVVNCNPFTYGHQYLIEKASGDNDFVYVFVVAENRSAFDFEIRMELVEEGTRHLKNVKVLSGGKYLVTGATFPSYFLKNEKVDLIAQKQAELDVRLFAKLIAPVLDINSRYVGTEVYCPTTAAYNKAMKKVLPEYGIELNEINRKTLGASDNYISASKVRNAIKNNTLTEVLDFLPPHTQEYLLSDDSFVVREKIRNSYSRH